MSIEQFIPLHHLCKHYEVEMSFFDNLNEFGLIEIVTVEKSYCIHRDKTSDLEKIIRMHQELNINLEGIDTIFNLLERIKSLESELTSAKNKLRVYED